jgi:glutaminyl-peptide cyclotransferase
MAFLVIVLGGGEKREAPRDGGRGGATDAPAFNAAAAFEDLRALVALGPRHHGSPGHAACRALIEARLREAGAEVRVDAFSFTGTSGTPEPFFNIFGRFAAAAAPVPPATAPAPLLIGTHYDTQARAHEDPDPANRDRPIPGANDGGSGVAVLLELARRLRARPPPVPVVLAFFDGEDYGGPGPLARDYMVGSRQAASGLDARPGDRPAAVVILDLVAMRGARFPRREDFQRGARALTDAVWGAAARLGVGHFTNDVAGPVTDDHSAFLDRGIPALVIIDLEYGPGNAWWHTMADTLDKCDPAPMGAVGRMLVEWIHAR